MVKKANLSESQQIMFDRAPHAWIETVVYDTMRTCLVVNPPNADSYFIHQDLHAGNIAVTSDFRGALADFGRSMFITKRNAYEFLQELQKAAFQNGALRKEMATLGI